MTKTKKQNKKEDKDKWSNKKQTNWKKDNALV